jgi:hypothetical protein
MAVTIGTNSWVTIAEADAYFNSRAGASMWPQLPEVPEVAGSDSKETFLVTAFYWLLDYSGLNLSAALTLPAVKRAQCEAALFLIQYRADYEVREAKIAGGVKQFSQSKWSETLDVQTMPKRILSILASAGIESNANFMVDLEQST